MGSERIEEIKDSEVETYNELSYKRFQRGDYKVRADSSNGGFRCPFCACEDEDGYTYFHLLQHAVYIAEDSKSGKQRVKHSAMAKYLAVDLDYEVKQYSDSDSDSDSLPLMKRYRSATSKVRLFFSITHIYLLLVFLQQILLKLYYWIYMLHAWLHYLMLYILLIAIIILQQEGQAWPWPKRCAVATLIYLYNYIFLVSLSSTNIPI